MPKYGLISLTDANTIELTLRLIFEYFPGEEINVTEIGIFDGQTARGIYEFVTSHQYGSMSATKEAIGTAHNFKYNYTAIDNNKDKEVLNPFPECNLIIGNSNEVYNQIEDNSQHLIFVDGDHSFAGVVADFFCYADKVKKGGYFAFHDTGKHIKPFSGFQHGDKNNSDAFISVRKALNKLGLLSNEEMQPTSTIRYWHQDVPENWELIFDEADINDPMGGICVFKKLY